MGSRCVVWTQVTFGILIPSCLQIIGLFTPYWIFEDGLQKGLFYQKQSDGSTTFEVLDQATLGLQATSAILLFLYAWSCCVTAGVYGPDDDGDFDNDDSNCLYTCNCLWFYCNIGMYIIASILMLAGCWKFGAQFPMENIGVSFYLCLSSCLLIWLMIFVNAVCCIVSYVGMVKKKAISEQDR